MEDLNAKWQRYDASRDEYVQRELALLRKEIARLNTQLEEKIRACTEVKRQLAAARTAQEATLERVQVLEQQVPVPSSAGKTAGWAAGLHPEPPERLLCSQVLTYKDDFRSERADRERAHGRIEELEDKVTSLLGQLAQAQVGMLRQASGLLRLLGCLWHIHLLYRASLWASLAGMAALCVTVTPSESTSGCQAETQFLVSLFLLWAQSPSWGSALRGDLV